MCGKKYFVLNILWTVLIILIFFIILYIIYICIIYIYILYICQLSHKIVATLRNQ